nr:hypothetical protein [Tanacetum cinerariifolium]
MAGEGPANMIARRVSDDLISFSGENAPPMYMRFFLLQNFAESRSLLATKDAKRGEEAKLVALNDVIVKALDEIETLENNVEILDGAGNYGPANMIARRVSDDLISFSGENAPPMYMRFFLLQKFAESRRLICVWMLDVDVSHLLGVVFGDIIIGLFIIVDWCSHLVDFMLYYAGSVEGCSIARLELGEVAESPRLPDKMRVAFTQARKEEASFAALMHELCFSLRVSLSKKRRLAAELEGLREQGNAVRAFENMKEIVARDSVTLGLLEQLLAHAQGLSVSSCLNNVDVWFG